VDHGKLEPQLAHEDYPYDRGESKEPPESSAHGRLVGVLSHRLRRTDSRYALGKGGAQSSLELRCGKPPPIIFHDETAGDGTRAD
jgi:hypothetical protein